MFAASDHGWGGSKVGGGERVVICFDGNFTGTYICTWFFFHRSVYIAYIFAEHFSQQTHVSKAQPVFSLRKLENPYKNVSATIGKVRLWAVRRSQFLRTAPICCWWSDRPGRCLWFLTSTYRIYRKSSERWAMTILPLATFRTSPQTGLALGWLVGMALEMLKFQRRNMDSSPCIFGEGLYLAKWIYHSTQGSSSAQIVRIPHTRLGCARFFSLVPRY